MKSLHELTTVAEIREYARQLFDSEPLAAPTGPTVLARNYVRIGLSGPLEID